LPHNRNISTGGFCHRHITAKTQQKVTATCHITATKQPAVTADQCLKIASLHDVSAVLLDKESSSVLEESINDLAVAQMRNQRSQIM
jgi:hypothetical protein